ncbi:MAG TPA: lamin tail domain-containing protein [Candidatus Saccharimonadales bacterium]|jgi:hypothetical protein
MFRVTRHIGVEIMAFLAVLLLVFPVYAGALATAATTQIQTPEILITEIQTNGGSAALEFIELYNTTDRDIVFGDDLVAGRAVWTLQFFNAAAVKTGVPVWTTAATSSNSVALRGTISAHDYFVLASTDYKPGATEPDQVYAPGASRLMTDTGGGLQLVSTDGSDAPAIWHDRVMWLNAAAAALPAGVLPAPVPGSSLQRQPAEADSYVAADGKLGGLVAAAQISPLDMWQATSPPPVPQPEVPVPEVPGDRQDDDASEDIVQPYVTELLPNPASPQTDAAHEYIEIYNPGDTEVDLEDYKLGVGTTTRHEYRLPADTVVAPHGYAAFYSADTRLSLANSGGQARLSEPDGDVLSETQIYGTATDNTAWSLQDGTWQWSATPTPAAANSIVAPLAKAAAKPAATKTAATTKTAAKKQATATKASAAKTRSAAAKKAKAAKAAAKKKTKKPKTTTISTAAAVKPKPPIHTAILVAVAVGAVLYGLYEYRHDISNKFSEFRENRAARRGNRGPAARRRSHSAY